MGKIIMKIDIILILFLVLTVLMLPSAHGFIKPDNRKIENGSQIFPKGSFSMKLENASMRDILRALAQESNLNIVISDEVEGRVTVNLKDVSFKSAFLSILRGAGLGYVVEKKIVRVDILKNLQEEKIIRLETIKKEKEALQKAREAERKTKEDEEKLIGLKTEAVKVNYIINSKATRSIAKELGIKKEVVKDLDGLKRALSKLLTDRKGASVEVVESKNTLLVTDIPKNVEKIVGLIKELDLPPKQVFIKARITELSTSSARELGIRWGGTYRTGSPSGGFTTGSYSITEGSEYEEEYKTGGKYTGGKYNVIGGAGDNYIVNLPADVGLGSGGAINFGLITDSLNLDVQLSALEDKGKVNILASPQIITQDNQRAYIKSGEEIPYFEGTFAGGVRTEEVEFKDVAIELEVTPHIVEESVFLDIVVARKEANRSISAREPPINSRAMTTKVSIKSGHTVVIGGLTVEDTSNNTSEVPYLSKIPVLGLFFKNKGKRKERMELLIFITPSIIGTLDSEA